MIFNFFLKVIHDQPQLSAFAVSTSAYWFRLQCLLMPRENRNLTALMVRKDYLLSLVSFLKHNRFGQHCCP